MRKVGTRPPAPLSAAPSLSDPHSLAAACAGLPCPPPAEVLPALREYLELLMRYNAVMNLVGTRSWRDTLETLVADSFCLATFLRTLPLPAQPLCLEAGAGAGLPGIPLRMCWTAGEYVLVEARQKRATFLQTVLARVPLARTRAHCGRVEDLRPSLPRLADLWVSRACMPWQKLLTCVAPHTAPGGLAVLLQSTPGPEVASGADLPPGWTWQGTWRYTVRARDRHFWALSRTFDGSSPALPPHDRGLAMRTPGAPGVSLS